VKNIKPSTLLAGMAWVSLFALCWLMIMGKIEGDMMTGGFGVLFFVVAFVASFQ